MLIIKAQPYLLKNTIQHYAWGTKGENSFIPKLLNVKSEKNKPYAEMWMGAHPKSPSKIIIDGNKFSLNEVIHQYPGEMLGNKTAKKFSNTLPFLFKVLSTNEVLSIQVHPDRKQAKSLHKKDPINYPDSNQKIEIAIALDSLTALVGFKTFKEISKVLKDYPELGEFIGNKFILSPKVLSRQNQKNFLRKIFSQLITQSIDEKNRLNTVIKKLYERISKKKSKDEIEKLFLDLANKYENDVGLFILFFLNLIHLKKGQAIFTKPGVPHAYLKGNILECMSNSDNVVRAGLTPKFKDAKTLLKILNYDSPELKILKGENKKNLKIYKTDAKEFEIQLFNPGKTKMVFNDQYGPRILLILGGVIKFIIEDISNNKQFEFSKGDTVFLPSILKNFQIASLSKSYCAIVSVPV